MHESLKPHDVPVCGDGSVGERLPHFSMATQAVVDHLVRQGAPGIPGAAALMACLLRPSEMPQPVFLALQTIEEDMERAVAQGRDCIEGFDGIHGEVARLLEASPWAFQPSHGCLRTAEVACVESPAWTMR